MERDLALGVLNRLGARDGAHPSGGRGNDPMSFGPNGGGAFDTPGFGDQGPQLARRTGPDAGGLFRTALGGGDLMTGSSLTVNRRAGQDGVFSFWEPRGSVELRGPGGSPVAQRPGANLGRGSRLREGAVDDRVVAAPQRGPGKLLGRGRRRSRLLGDGPLPVAGLPGDGSHHGLGRNRLRHGDAEPGSGEGSTAQDRAFDGDGGGGSTGRPGGLLHGRIRAGFQGRHDVGPNRCRRRAESDWQSRGHESHRGPFPDGAGGGSPLPAQVGVVGQTQSGSRTAARTPETPRRARAWISPAASC